jgi:hypothetical protein
MKVPKPAAVLLVLLSGCALLSPAESGRDAAGRQTRHLSSPVNEEDGEVVLEVRMPGVTTTSMDEYHCLNVELPDEPLNLVEIESLSEQGLVHHMLLYGATFVSFTATYTPYHPSCNAV